jgi:(p)ppGpp synthase/HD superfamily hydrolase
MNLNIVLARMIALAAKAHENQTDKAGRPYINHCIAVMGMIASEHPDDYELQCIAIAHDIIEDTKVTYQDLMNLGCCTRIIRGITSMTRQRGQTEEEYLEQVLSNKDAIKVKMKDIIHNSDIRRLKGLTEKDFARAQKYQKSYVILKTADESL